MHNVPAGRRAGDAFLKIDRSCRKIHADAGRVCALERSMLLVALCRATPFPNVVDGGVRAVDALP
ncbi:hypothetical protein QM996_25935 (plasmid) [Sinorhizobium chiapasense]|uniref:hypothetical protein n=1 Tax=Sinorhizobium chiapasense TaxID=501572 RepID=UPI002FE2DFA4